MAKIKNISLGDEAQKRLGALVEKANATSASQAVRDALRFYEFLVEESNAGTEFYIRKKDDELTKIKFFY
jgi:Arc/MetJ-type ribon-helix-helix transcriptional regulator